MPLYETIMIARVGESRQTTSLLKQVAQTALLRGGNVRDLRILGDRILTRAVPGKDNQKHILGRYTSILYDGNDQVKEGVEESAKASYEFLRTRTFKHKDFLGEAALYKKAFNQFSNPIQNEQKLNQDYIQQMAALAKLK